MINAASGVRRSIRFTMVLQMTRSGPASHAAQKERMKTKGPALPGL
jgi:hypothetical protein